MVVTKFHSDIMPLNDSRNTHLQIIHTNNTHWVCCYYDRSSIFIYDSLKSTRERNIYSVDIEILNYLKALFPFHDFQQKPIKFPKVQYQPNGYDCGPFAMAIVTSLLFELDP